MQLLCFGLFTIICSYSLVISAPINQTITDSQETKQQKLIASASRLLKELAHEQYSNRISEPIQSGHTKGNENIGYLLTLDTINDDESSSEVMVIDGILLNNEQELIRYLEEPQYFDEDSIPVLDIPIMDDGIMEEDDR